MSHDEQIDDADDDYGHQPRPRPSSSPVLVIALVVGGVLVLAVIGCGLVGLFGFRAIRQEAAVQQREGATVAAAKAGATKRVYTRDGFKKLVIGKTTEEVIQAIGRPDSTTDRQGGGARKWYYLNQVTNPATDRPGLAVVEFDAAGRVEAVSW